LLGFAAALRLDDSPALRREAEQPIPDNTAQRINHTDKLISGLDLNGEYE
jgi:hypothetical protein